MANESAVTSRERPATDTPPGNNGQPRPSGPDGQTAEPQDPRRKTIGWVIAAAVLIFGGIYGYNFWKFSTTHVSTDDAYITGNVVNVSPIIGGTLSQLTVDEGDTVKAGQLIARLDDSSQIASLRQAQEAYDAAQSQVPQARTNLLYERQTTAAAIEKAQDALKTQSAKTAAAHAQIILTRATTENEVNQATQQVSMASAQAAQADATADAAETAVAAARQTVQTMQQAADAAEANVASAEANDSRDAADEARYSKLLAQQAVTQQQYDVAHATYVSADSQLNAVRHQVEQAQSQVVQSQVAVQQAQAQALSAQKAAKAAHQEVEVARAGLMLAEANDTQVGISQNNFISNQTQGSQAEADLSTALAGQQQVEMKREQIATLQAQAAQSKAALADAQVQEEDTKIYAPSDGQVVRKGANVGAAISPGQTIVTMTTLNANEPSVWLEANFKETQMEGVEPGEPVDVDVDAFPGKVFKGKVDSIDTATGAVDTLLPPDNATGNFTKVVQRIPVKIVFFPAGPGDGSQYATADDIAQLRQGMSATPTIDISQHKQ